MGRTKGSKNKKGTKNSKNVKNIVNPDNTIDPVIVKNNTVKKVKIVSSGNIVICDKCNHRINSISQLDLVKSTDLTVLSYCPECNHVINVTSLIVLKSFVTYPTSFPVLLSEQ
jgi:hypothetical protein